MEPVRMCHPDHGFTHAYSNAEIEALEKLGWSIEVPAEVPVEAPKAERPKRKYTRKAA